MNDKKIIVIGLIIFLIMILFPFWYNIGKTAPAPELKLSKEAKAAKECVRPKELMKSEHMQLLDTWRDTVVRDARRVYINSEGKEFNMSLSTGEKSCIGCHVDKAEFCDKCHNYALVDPYCWDCHIDPKEKKGWKATEEAS